MLLFDSRNIFSDRSLFSASVVSFLELFLISGIFSLLGLILFVLSDDVILNIYIKILMHFILLLFWEKGLLLPFLQGINVELELSWMFGAWCFTSNGSVKMVSRNIFKSFIVILHGWYSAIKEVVLNFKPCLYAE